MFRFAWFHRARTKFARALKTAQASTRPIHQRLNLEQLEDRLTPANSSPAISFAVVNDWGSGFQGQITVTDTLATPLNNWSLSFDFDHAITQMWNGVIASHTGNLYVVNNAGYNASIAPGTSVEIGFLGNPGNVTDQPTNYSLTYNGSSGQPANQPPTVATPAAASPDAGDWQELST